MTVLITLGNLNQFTFANSIIAANIKSQELFNKPLNKVEIFHSSESFNALQFAKIKDTDNWVTHIEKQGISEHILVHQTIEITSTKQSVENFVSRIESIISYVGQQNKNLILDLTNGTTLSKNLFSTTCYILDIQHQYLIDVSKLIKLTNEKGFIEPNILQQSYITVPDSTYLDNIAYLSLSEVLRYKRIIESHTMKYAQVCEGNNDVEFFSSNLRESIKIKLDGDKRSDNAIYRIAVSSISGSAEDLISKLIDRFVLGTDSNRTFGQKLVIIREEVEKCAPENFDVEFYRKFNDFVLYLRNSSTHKGQVLTDLEKFKADLSVKMAFPFIEFYTDIIFKLLSEEKIPKSQIKIAELSDSTPAPGSVMYYGLDGDDTGKILEELFLMSKKEAHFRKISKSITDAITKIRKQIEKNTRCSIIFEAGDDLLFKGSFSKKELEEFQKTYKETSSLTCSIGFGSSFLEVYLALKLSKTKPGKNSITGVECRATTE